MTPLRGEIAARCRCTLLIIAVGLVLGALALIVMLRERDHRADIARAWADATATIMAQLAERSLQSMSISLDDTIAEIESAWDAGIIPGTWLNGRFDRVIAAMPQLVAVLLTDARGAIEVSWYNNANGPPADLSDRDFVRVWLEGAAGDIYVSPPLKTRVIGDWWYFAISRPVRAADGELIGVFASMVDVDYLAALFGQSIDRPGEIVALVNDAGQILVTAGGGLEPGQQLSDATMQAVRDQGPTQAITRLVPDGDPMIVVGDPLQSYGLHAVTLSPRPTLAAVAAWPTAIWAMLWAAATGLICLNARHRARQAAAKRLIERHAKALELTARDLETARQRAESARREAETANNAKSRFLAMMSHELRTPLNAILGFSELIRDRPFGDADMTRYAEYASDINVSGQHLLELINDILDLAKIDSGRLELTPEPNDLAAILTEVETVIRPRCTCRSLRLGVRVDPTLAGLQSDRRALKQIVLNLLDNAVKATPATGRIDVAATLRADGDVEIAVSDTGIGIPNERLADLFRPFEQVDNRYSKSGSGVGLGLVLVKQLTELHGGRLEIDTTLNVGTTVSVIFPAFRAIRSHVQPADPQPAPAQDDHPAASAA
ncbi:MAG: hypothetical protein H6842_03965 [Rhodospirillaceae bacterium]|nr:hypothetical protein [Rhodospirillaceae bacterium]